MSIVTTGQADRLRARARTLDVVVLHARDAEAATDGRRRPAAAERRPGAGSPLARSRRSVSAVVRETDLPGLRGAEPAETPHLGGRQRPRRARGLLPGAGGRAGSPSASSTATSRSTARRCAEMCAELGGVPLDVPRLRRGARRRPRLARRDVGLPGLEAVVSAGSTRGLAHGAEELIARCRQRPAGGASCSWPAVGSTPELVPWLVRAGVRRFAIGSSARSSGSWTRASVDVDHVRSWRMLLDDALSRALGHPRRLTPTGHVPSSEGCCSGAGAPSRS